MKRILSILLVLISINVLGQEKEITYKSFLVIGFEGFRGINNVDDISKYFSGKTINTDKIYLKHGLGLKIYDFIHLDFIKKSHPINISTGVTFFNKGNIISFPLDFRTEFGLSRRIGFSAYVGGRYFMHANNDYNNKIFLEYGAQINIRILNNIHLYLGWSVINSANYMHADLPFIPLTKGYKQ